MGPSIKKLSHYLNFLPHEESTKLTFSSTEKSEYPWKGRELPWNGETCLTVVCYVIKFCSNKGWLGRTIRYLDRLSSEYGDLIDNPWDSMSKLEINMSKKRHQFSEMFVDYFMPYLHKFFKVPKVEDILVFHKPNLPREPELLAAFMDFLLQILNSEAQVNSYEQQRYALLQKELTFLLSILGDIPFECIELEKVTHLLAEFETLANEVGSFIYSCVLVTRHIEQIRFIEGINAILRMVELLKEKIKEHCINFSSKLLSRLHVTTPMVVNAIDSLFIVDSLLEDLENLIMNPQVKFNIINDDMKLQIKTLNDELMLARSLLKGDTGMDELKESLIQIRYAAYEAEYLVNSHVVGNIPFWYMSIRLPTVIEKIKLVTTNLHGKTKNNYDVMKVSKVVENVSNEVSFQDMGAPKIMVDNIVVGLEDERIEILSDLIGGSNKRQIISIFGMPGLGKTTMARKLYNDHTINGTFDRQAWCVVSQTYQKKRVLSNILTSLSGDPDNNLNREDESLALEIFQILKRRKYLIVMDDVWSLNLWYELDRFFPDDGNGSRIMFTSRIKDVVPTNSIFHSLPLLMEDQCWSLLENEVFSRKSKLCPPRLVDIGKRIASKCGGLPLAVIVTAGVLVNLDKEESAWEKIERNFNSYIFQDDKNDYLKILELSFKHLPDHLKLCFLYFGTFPEDTKIPIWKLTWLWIAEGFIKREHDKSPEQVAEEYLWDLINRSLIQIADRKSDGGIKTCIIHDLLRDMCLRRAHEENFSKSLDDYSSIYEKQHRLFVHSEFTTGMRPFGLHNRTFSGHVTISSSSIPQMKLLRVMDKWSIRTSSGMSQRIDLLVQLRYLAYDQMLNPVVSNFINLEFLYLTPYQSKNYIPSAILKIVKLRHLRVEYSAEFGEDCDSSQTTNLRSLSNICINSDKDEQILLCSPHLRKLNCYYTNEALFPDLYSFTALESLKMVFKNQFFGELTKFNFPSTVKKISLRGIRLPWEHISIIGKLPNLHVLKLVLNAFEGEEWETSDGEFQELRFLKLDMMHLKQWITCSEHFPQLQCLILDTCRNLKEIPNEIGDIPTLNCIQVLNSSYQASLSAVWIEEEQRDQYGNEELKVIINNKNWSKEQLAQECRKLVLED